MICFAPQADTPESDAVRPDDATPGTRAARALDGAASTPPVPDPFDDVDALEELGDEIATLAAHVAAATHRMLVLIADFDRRRGWELGGHRSCAHWLAVRAGMKLNAAREKVRTARVLVGLPGTGASMGRGELSYSAVRALTRVATPGNEAELLDFARGATTAEIERMVRSHRSSTPKGDAELERERHESRTLSVFPDHDGMYVVKGRLTPELGALLMRAVEAASDALYREERGMPDQAGEASDEERRRQAARRRADALGLLAERALAAGLTGDDAPVSGSRAERYQVVIHGDVEMLTGDAGAPSGSDSALTDDPDAPARHESVPADESAFTDDPYAPTGHPSAPTPEPYRPTAHQSVLAPGRSPAHAELDDGTRVTAVTFWRLCCDAAVVPVVHGHLGSDERLPAGSHETHRVHSDRREADGAHSAGGEGHGVLARPAQGGPVYPGRPRSRLHRPILSVGRRTRTIPPALRRALDARDRGCRFPGCGLRFTDAHHVEHWADGGETSLDNCVLLCRHHHRLVHEGGWKMSWWGEGRPVFFDPRGGAHYDGRWSPPEPADGSPPSQRQPERDDGSTPSPDRPEQTAESTPFRDRPHPDLASALLAHHRARGIDPDGWTLGAEWERGVDIPDDVYFRAREAVG